MLSYFVDVPLTDDQGQPTLFQSSNNFFVKTSKTSAKLVRDVDKTGELGKTKWFARGTPVDITTLVECGCCGCYHPANYFAECRDDDYRFLSWETRELLENK